MQDIAMSSSIAIWRHFDTGIYTIRQYDGNYFLHISCFPAVYRNLKFVGESE